MIRFLILEAGDDREGLRFSTTGRLHFGGFSGQAHLSLTSVSWINKPRPRIHLPYLRPGHQLRVYPVVSMMIHNTLRSVALPDAKALTNYSKTGDRSANDISSFVSSRETLIARINLALVCLARSFVVTSDIASRSVRWLSEGEVSIETCLPRLLGARYAHRHTLETGSSHRKFHIGSREVAGMSGRFCGGSSSVDGALGQLGKQGRDRGRCGSG